jgi:hypothetical protein
MFILRSLVEKYTKNGKHFFTCFIDFKKAFDLVDHTFLMYKLHRIGISGNIYSLLKDMYINKGMKLHVKSAEKLSQHFTSNIGVNQGDPCSPNLFKIFINDISNYIKTCDKAPNLNNVPVSYLLYADDVVLLAQNEEDLQKSVHGLEKFCSDWGLTEKTKVLVFNRTGKIIKTKVTYNNTVLENVQIYKYLGIQFHASGKFEIARQDLVDRSLKAMFKLTSTFKNIQPSFITSMHLFDRMVKPVLTYGADICGYRPSKCASLYNEMKKDVMEKCHLKYCRFVLGVNKRAPNIGIYGETGRFPMFISSVTLYIKYWHRLAQCDKKDVLLYNAYRYNIDNNSTWKKGVVKLLDLGSTTIERACKTKCNVLTRMIAEKCKLEFRNEWRNELFNDSRTGNFGNKLRCLRTFKDRFRFEPYLQKCNNTINRKNIAKLRLSCHRLQIEIGRYNSGPSRLRPEERICRYCTSGHCEDELHFIIECPLYENERKLLFKCLNMYPNFAELDSKNKFIFLMSNEETSIIKAVGNYVTQCFIKRSNSEITYTAQG